jgi:predicted dehydrogenase
MRAGIAGTGFIARVHATALRAIGVEVAAVAGTSREKAEAFGEGVPHDDVTELLERERIDVLHVCTPNDVHAAQAVAALERGVHVVCEKPLAVSTEQAQRMIDAAEGLVNATCYHVRGYPLVEEMRARVAGGELGEVALVHGRYLCDDVLFPALGWRVDPDRSGSSYAVADLGTHWLDLAEHVTGQTVVELLAELRSFTGGPLEDYASLLLRYSDGASGSLILAARTAGRKNQLLFECEGDLGGLTWDQERPTELLYRPLDRPTQLVVKDPLANAPSARAMSRYPAGHGEGYGGAFRNLFENVYAAVAGREHAPFPTFRDGARGVATVEAAVRSNSSWVRV